MKRILPEGFRIKVILIICTTELCDTKGNTTKRNDKNV